MRRVTFGLPRFLFIVFFSVVKQARDLDALQRAHDEYLHDIQCKAQLFLHADYVKGEPVPEGGWGGGTARRPARARALEGRGGGDVLGTTFVTGLLDELFKTILQFCGTQNQLHTDIATLVSTRRLRRARAAERTAEGRWGLGADDADDDEGRALGQEYDREADDAANIVGTYASSTVGIAEQYKAQFEHFLETLRVHENFSENFRFLTFRLDFNKFYQTSADPEAVRQRMALETRA